MNKKEIRIIPEEETLLNEKIEQLFKLKISSSGNYIEIIFKTGSRTVVIAYSEFLELRNSIRSLIDSEVIDAKAGLSKNKIDLNPELTQGEE